MSVSLDTDANHKELERIREGGRERERGRLRVRAAKGAHLVLHPV